MFIKNITKIFEGLIYILLGVVTATILIILFTSLPTNDVAKVIEEITEISIFTIFILQIIPTKYVNNRNNKGLKRFLYMISYSLKYTHIALGVLFISLRILHIEINLLFEPIKWNMETITSTLLSIILIPTIIYAILRINNSEKYRIPHRLFLILTYLIFIIHLFH